MDVTVTTRYGTVRGRRTGAVAAFKGIPYAAPPFGAHRMRPPVPPARWDGVRAALDYGPTPPKPPYIPPYDAIMPEPMIDGEDCLGLNVWTPDPGGSGLPVMVWIHGGAFINGSGAVPWYDGRRFARDGIVCVTINYRLGVEGFLHLGDGVANLGLQDQAAALRWVQENISAFGGDPANVTVFGESAGAMSIACLLVMPMAKGLFRRAILQSGAGHHALSPATAMKIGGYVAERLGVPATREAIAAASPATLLEAQKQVAVEAFTAPDPAKWGEVARNVYAFAPVVDGEVLPTSPIPAIAAGAGAEVDLVTGYNVEEQRLFLVPSGDIHRIRDVDLANAAGFYGLPPEGLGEYRATHAGEGPGAVLSAVVTDWFFRIPAIRLAEAQSRGGGAIHMYEFAWRSPLHGGELGACHGLEIPFVFDNLDAEGTENLVGEGAPQSLADETHAAWVSFARAGDPGWPRYDATSRTTMRFDVGGGEPRSDPEGRLRSLWDGIR